jgi:hypothetical protein
MKEIGCVFVRSAVLVLTVGLALGGCDGGEAPDSAGSAPEPLAFASPADLYDWVEANAARRGLADVVVKRTAQGEIATLTMSAESRTVLMRELHGAPGYFEMAGERVVLSDRADSGATDGATVTSALVGGLPSSRSDCSGAFCISGEAFNTHFSLFGIGYHHVGGRTRTTPRSIVAEYSPNPIYGPCPVVSDPNGFCRNAFGCRPQMCVVGSYCNGSDVMETRWRTDRSSFQVCVHSYGAVNVASLYFSNTTNCGSGHCITVPEAVGFTTSSSSTADSVESSLSAFGTFTFPCANSFGPAECYIDGVCAFHSASGNGGSVSVGTTGAGSYDCN